MRYLTLNEVLELHHHLIQTFGGAHVSPLQKGNEKKYRPNIWGETPIRMLFAVQPHVIRDISGLESAISQPRMTFDGEELHPTVIEKSVALGYSIIKNHPFVDETKELVGHAAMEVFLVLNGFEITSTIDEQEKVILRVASGEMGRGELEDWSRALDLRNKETEGHSQRVTDMTMKLARTIGMREEELVHVHHGALLHDIGKIGVPDHILLKPDTLTDEEWVIMKKHPQFAYEMLSPINYLRQHPLFTGFPPHHPHMTGFLGMPIVGERCWAASTW